MKKKNVLVSIITVCYNSEKTIRKTIESVVNQTYKNIEYLIVDGGSKDTTIAIVKEFKEKYPFIKYVSEPDNGIYDAMNKGIKMAKGEIIGMINSDDYYETDTVQNIVNNMSDDKYQVLYGYMNIFKNGILEKTEMYYHWAINKNMINHPTCFITKKTYEDFFLYDLKYKSCADYDFMIKLTKEKEVKFIPLTKILANFNYGGVSQKVDSHIECTKMLYHHNLISKSDYYKTMLKLRIKKIFKI